MTTLSPDTQWALAGLSLGRGAAIDLTVDEAKCVEAVLEHLAAAPPLGVILDLHRLLLGQALAPAHSWHPEDRRLTDALLAYEEHLLGRVAHSPTLSAARDAVKRHPNRSADCVSVVVNALLEALGDLPLEPLPLGPVRRTLRRSASDAIDQGVAALADTHVVSRLAAEYDALAAAARRTHGLLTTATVFALENIEALRATAQRYAFRQLARVSETLAKGLPQKIRRSRTRPGRSDSSIEDENDYPIGGYGAITNTGGLESLLTSELVYMDRAPDGIDLFAVRWASGELLKYTRDESALSRDRRLIGVVLAADVHALRTKSAGWPCQHLVAALAVIGVAVHAWSRWYANAEFEVRIFVEHAQEIPQELQLLKLLLRVSLELGTVTLLETAHEAEDAIAALDDAAERAQVDCLRIAHAPLPPWEGPKDIGCFDIRPSTAADWPSFAAAARALIKRLV